MRKLKIPFTLLLLLGIYIFPHSQNAPNSTNALVRESIDRGFEAERSRDFDKAFEFYRKAHDDAGADRSADAAEANLRLGTTYIEKGYSDQAGQCLETALQNFTALGDDYRSQLAQTHFRLGELDYLAENYDASMRHFETGLGILGQLSGVSPLDLARGVSGCAKGCVALNRVEQANDYFVKAVKYVESPSSGVDPWELYSIRLNIAEYAAKGGEAYRDRAFTAYQLALNSAESQPVNKDPARVEVNLSRGNYQINLQNPAAAIKDLLEAERLALRTYQPTSPVLTAVYTALSRAYVLDGDLAKATESANKALAACGQESPSNSYSYEYLDALIAHGEALAAANSADAMGSFSNALQVVQNIRRIHRERGNRFALGQLTQRLSKSAVKCLYHQYKSAKDAKVAEQAFEYAETSKASLLLDALRELETRRVAGVPAEQLGKERLLRADLAWVDKMIYSIQKYPEAAPAGRLGEFEARRKDLLNQYEALVKGLEKGNSRYFTLGYAGKNTPVEEVRKSLDDDVTLVEYLLTDSAVYIFTMDKTSLEMEEVPIKKRLLTQVIPFLVSLKTSNYEAFIPAGTDLYSVLIGPVRDRLKTKKLLIVPDLELNYISFELLLEPAPVSQDGDFRPLAYLLRKYQVFYNYSAGLFVKSKSQSEALSPTKGFLGVAPDFANMNYTDMRSRLASNEDTSSVFANLPGAEEEVTILGKLLKGDTFTGQLATEENFKKQAKEYGILHLATHTIINNSNPLFSKLVLTAGGEEDGLLNTYELFGMDLNAELVTLSACNSGIGNITEGEGVMSLARGFAYAGAPNVVMSLWPVPDASTATIMESFYKYLNEGLPKGEALQRAKTDYIDNASRLAGSPYFWGCFVVVGNNDPMHWSKLDGGAGVGSVPAKYLWIGGGLLALLVAGAGWAMRGKGKIV